jgi:hypothetical protein
VNVNDARPSIGIATLLISKTPGGYSTSYLHEWFECSPEIWSYVNNNTGGNIYNVYTNK